MSKADQFIKTIQKNSDIIHKAASIYTTSQHDKEDLTQEIIYQLWKSYDSFQNKSSISTWIYRVAMNVSIYFLKQSKNRSQSFTQIPFDTHTPISDKSEDKWRKIHQQINQLNLVEKGIIMLYLDGKNYKEIAEIIGISESNVGTKLNRIKIKLRNNINKKKQA